MKKTLYILFIVLSIVTSLALLLNLPFIFIGGFILITVDLLLIVLLNKKITKIIKFILVPVLGIILLLQIIWTILFSIDLSKFENHQEPEFAQDITNTTYYQKYHGVGYVIHINNGFNPDTKKIVELEGEFILFGKVISAWIT